MQRTPRPTAVALATLLFSAGSALAAGEIIVVTAGDDTVDFGGAQRIADLPGPDGMVSIAEAVIAANNTPGAQTIRFAIPQSQWWTLMSDRAVIPIEYALWVNDPDTTIDFASQTAFTGDTNPQGNEVGLYYVGPPSNVALLNLNADRCTVRGMDMGRGNAFGGSIAILKNDCKVVACTTDTIAVQAWGQSASGNIIGGALPGEGNRFFEIQFLSGASGNTVIGNVFSHVRIAGDTLYGFCANNRIGGPTVQERNVISGYGRYGEEGLPTGTHVEVSGASGTVIEGNYIGTTEDGMASAGQRGPGGVFIGKDASATTLRGNLISGLRVPGIDHYQGQVFGVAVDVAWNASGTVIAGNRIGPNAAGTGVIGNVNGVLVEYTPSTTPPTGTRIGGPGSEDANLITASENSGIRVSPQVQGVTIQGNSIFGNGVVNPAGLGIDLLPPSSAIGVTPNDTLDPDTGANGLQNFPDIAGAERTADGIAVHGSFNSLPNSDFRLEFFSSSVCGNSGFGEGAAFLGSTLVHTDAGGNASFDVSFESSVGDGSVATATATHLASGSTSEFSACAPFTGSRCPADFDHSGFVDTDDFDTFIASFISGDPSADYDGTGFVDTDDFDAFVRAFAAGC